jgi:hypothetical protein
LAANSLPVLTAPPRGMVRAEAFLLISFLGEPITDKVETKEVEIEEEGRGDLITFLLWRKPRALRGRWRELEEEVRLGP